MNNTCFSLWLRTRAGKLLHANLPMHRASAWWLSCSLAVAAHKFRQFLWNSWILWLRQDKGAMWACLTPSPNLWFPDALEFSPSYFPTHAHSGRLLKADVDEGCRYQGAFEEMICLYDGRDGALQHQQLWYHFRYAIKLSDKLLQQR